MTTTLIATFSAQAGHRERVAELIADYAAAVRSSSGTLLFEPTTAVHDDHAFTVFERYADEDAFTAHLAAPENAAFGDAVAEHLVAGIELAFLDEIEVG